MKSHPYFRDALAQHRAKRHCAARQGEALREVVRPGCPPPSRRRRAAARSGPRPKKCRTVRSLGENPRECMERLRQQTTLRSP